MKSSEDIVVLSTARTPIGKFMGSLMTLPTGKLGALVVKAAIERAGIAPEMVDQVILGSVLTAGSGQNVARQAALWAGLPSSVPAFTVNMVCGSGIMSLILAAQAIIADGAEIVVAGGAENMSASPYLLPRAREGYKMGHVQALDSMLCDGLTDVFNDVHMGIIAENIAEQYGVSRSEQDAFALHSQEKAKAAVQSGRFLEEIVPVEIQNKKTSQIFIQDEYPRLDCTLEKLACLKPAFKQEGSITAGNSSGINDGAAAIVLARQSRVKDLGLHPLAVIRGWSTVGVDPAQMGLGPIPAVQKLLQQAGISLMEIDLIEANEAFAAQCLAVIRTLGIPVERLNVNGGAIALGHPIGASGARITVTLIQEMRKRSCRLGLATLCIGGGMGAALLVENANN